jgi:putative hydrolase of HD superfamily
MPAREARHPLDTLLELQALDRLPRVGYAMRGVAAPESVAEHLFHVGFLVWLAGREEEGLDLGRALEIALLHDLAEVRLGDLPRPAAGYFPPGVKAAAERAMLADILAPLAGDPASGPVAALADYQQGGSREARLVAACDKLQLLIKAYFYHQAGNRNVAEFFAAFEGFDDGGFVRVGELARELHRRIGSAET